MIEFFQTAMGRKFFEGTMPKLANTLERIAAALEKQLEFQAASPPEDDPLVQKDDQYQAEYMEIDRFVGEIFPEDYEQGEWANMQLCDFVKGLLQELKERRMDSEKEPQ